jgi:solute carrier family 25 (mitochondrial phosphate transporter), member 23/24/25/41
MSKSNKEKFDDTYSGAQAPPLLPSTRGDPEQAPRTATTLAKYRDLEGEAARERRLRALWKALPSTSDEIILWNAKPQSENGDPSEAQMNAERIEKLRNIYNQELMNRVGGTKAKPVGYTEFVKVCTLLRWNPMAAQPALDTVC